MATGNSLKTLEIYFLKNFQEAYCAPTQTIANPLPLLTGSWNTGGEAVQRAASRLWTGFNGPVYDSVLIVNIQILPLNLSHCARSFGSSGHASCQAHSRRL